MYTKTKQIIISQLNTNEVWVKEIQLFPNPTNGQISISNLDYDRVEIFDLSGRKMQIFKTQTNEYLLFDVNHLATGSYLIQLTKNNTTQSFSFIKN